MHGSWPCELDSVYLHDYYESVLEINKLSVQLDTTILHVHA